jgi:hypothetical protein
MRWAWRFVAAVADEARFVALCVWDDLQTNLP